jgi:hypothetical protein
MTHHGNHDGKPSWIGARTDDVTSGSARIETITHVDSDTITFAPEQRGDDERTTAWITAHADLVVDVTDMR